MQVDLHERLIAGALEAVHLARLDDEDVTRAGLELHAIHYPVSAALSDELNFIVGMSMRPGSLSGKAVIQKYGNADIALVGADEMVRASAVREIFLAGTMHRWVRKRIGVSALARPRAARGVAPSDTARFP